MKSKIRFFALVILFSIPNISIAQSDSVKVIEAITEALRKSNYKGNLSINISSNNQKGGQTGFVITNNYYGDTLKDENNLQYRETTFNNRHCYAIAPKKGTWQSPYVMYPLEYLPSSLIEKRDFGILIDVVYK